MSLGSCGKIALAATLAFSVGAAANEQVASAWDGVWWQAWGEFTPMKVVVRDGKVVECLYLGRPQSVGNFRTLSVSPSQFSFGDPPDFIATLTMNGKNHAMGHFHGPRGETDASMDLNER